MKKWNNEELAAHLGGMVRYATVSNAESALMDFSTFYGLHEYLKKTYPLVHEKLKCEVIGTAGLLYTWKGTGKSENLPIMLCGHQDVVPTGDLSGWKYGPFEAVTADGALWGRGTSDCKNIILADLEAVEALLEEGFTPDYDIYLGFGFNEEVFGGDEPSAQAICNTLKERGVTLGLLIDEGEGAGTDPEHGINTPVALVCTSEKGYVDIKVALHDAGGHSMAPTKRSLIAELGQIAIDLMKEQYPYRLTDTVAQEYRTIAPLMGGEKGRLLSNLDNDFEAAIPVIDADPQLAAKFHTTMAITMTSASPQANILPREASFTMNSRLLVGDSLEGLLEKVKKVAGPDAEVTVLKGNDASQESRTDSVGYRCVKELTEELVPDVTVVPSLVCGGTDARNYYPICDTVLRYSGYPAREGLGVHNFNEHIFIEDLDKGPDFMYRLIKKYGDFR